MTLQIHIQLLSWDCKALWLFRLYSDFLKFCCYVGVKLYPKSTLLVFVLFLSSLVITKWASWPCWALFWCCWRLSWPSWALSLLVSAFSVLESFVLAYILQWLLNRCKGIPDFFCSPLCSILFLISLLIISWGFLALIGGVPFWHNACPYLDCLVRLCASDVIDLNLDLFELIPDLGIS